MSSGLKHLIQCRCILPQFKKLQNPPRHKFVVFSVIADDGNTTTKFVQCNNCGIIHKVIDIGRSEIVSGREFMSSIMSIDEIRSSLPEKLANILTANDCDLPTWEAAKFINENKRWGEFVVLSSDEEDGMRQGKYVTIIGDNLIKVDSFTREEVIRS